MLITADSLFAHAIGDYVIQSDYMASEKTKSSIVALSHAISYSIPFMFLTESYYALAAIVLSHFIIDRWRLARYLCWLKNFLAPKWIEVHSVEGKVYKARNLPFSECSSTGYPQSKPVWMSVWLMIITDNCMHVLCNALAMRYM